MEVRMSLTKKPTMTKKRVAASQANGKRSHGPATPQGRKRIREANTRHGFYSQAQAVALACLGEDPADLERLRKNLLDSWQIPSALREELAEHLVQVVWRWKRAGRSQEGFALRLAKQANLTREDRLHAQMMRLTITAETLRRLARSVAHEHYVTTPADLETMKNLHQEGVLKEMGEIALALFCQLQAPGTGEDELDSFEAARKVVAQVKEIFGIGTRPPFAPRVNVAPDSRQPQEAQHDAQDGVAPDVRSAHADLRFGATEPEELDERYPRITAAEWEARERPRQLLENILTRQVEICEAQRNAILKESLAGPSPFERAAEIALAHPDAALMQRMEESSFRQIWRIVNLLLKIKRQCPEEESREIPPRTHNVYERKAG
jgi:hypothetical protein